MAENLENAAHDACRGAATVEGWTPDDELRFLFLAAARPTARGEVLEIGSYKGRSTVALARGALWAGQRTVVACDPFTIRSPTDPEHRVSTYEDFLATLQQHALSDNVEVHRERSEHLAARWDRPIRFLWVDGNHDYEAVRADIEGFRAHLAPGALLALHDVGHHDYNGPLLCFMDDVLLADEFGMCGIHHSIGWTQFIGRGGRAKYRRQKATLYKWLAARRLRQTLRVRLRGIAKWRYKIYRRSPVFEKWILSDAPRAECAAKEGS